MSRALSLREIDDGAERWSDRLFDQWFGDDADDTPEEDAGEPDAEPDEPELDEALCFGGVE